MRIAFITLLILFTSCVKDTLKEISVSDFSAFVKATNYKTDAEQFEWSIVQTGIYNYHILYGIDWRCPDGINYAQQNHPVTQVSYNDALAYANWSGTRLPSYGEYWQLVNPKGKNINFNSTEIFAVEQSNLIGNVWELTRPDEFDRIRLAGGSYLCAPNSCNGTSPDRELYVDRTTGNTHIGFAVIDREP